MESDQPAHAEVAVVPVNTRLRAGLRFIMLATNGYLTGQTINVNGGWYMSKRSLP